jgi:Family of unknown function (DUF6328)
MICRSFSRVSEDRSHKEEATSTQAAVEQQHEPRQINGEPLDGGPGRDESPWDRLDRNTIELIQELRVAGTGIQVLFAFLLVVPFNSRFDRLSSFDRDLYFVALVCIAIAAILLIAPSIHHRLLFRRQQKEYLVAVGNTMLIVGAVFLAVGLTAILLLISNLIFGAAAAVIVGTITGFGVMGLWFAMPLAHRRSLRRLTPN